MLKFGRPLPRKAGVRPCSPHVRKRYRLHVGLGFPKSAVLDRYWQQIVWEMDQERTASQGALPKLADRLSEMELGQVALFQAILEMCVQVCLREGRAPEDADFQKMLERGEELFEQAGGASS